MNKYLFILISCFFALLHVNAQTADFEKIESNNFKRLYRLNDSLYRSEQPNKKGFTELELLGIKTVINFRRVKDPDKKARHSSLNVVHLPLKASELTEDDILEALKLIRSSEKPVLIHCWHGSDRTGAIAAASRIVFEDWSKERAISELKTKGFGHHEKRFPNVTILLGNLNVERLKDELGL